MWGMFVNNFQNHGGEPLPHCAALTPEMYYLTTGTISLFTPFAISVDFHTLPSF